MPYQTTVGQVLSGLGNMLTAYQMDKRVDEMMKQKKELQKKEQEQEKLKQQKEEARQRVDFFLNVAKQSGQSIENIIAQLDDKTLKQLEKDKELLGAGFTKQIQEKVPTFQPQMPMGKVVPGMGSQGGVPTAGLGGAGGYIPYQQMPGMYQLSSLGMGNVPAFMKAQTSQIPQQQRAQQQPLSALSPSMQAEAMRTKEMPTAAGAKIAMGRAQRPQYATKRKTVPTFEPEKPEGKATLADRFSNPEEFAERIKKVAAPDISTVTATDIMRGFSPNQMQSYVTTMKSLQADISEAKDKERKVSIFEEKDGPYFNDIGTDFSLVPDYVMKGLAKTYNLDQSPEFYKELMDYQEFFQQQLYEKEDRLKDDIGGMPLATELSGERITGLLNQMRNITDPETIKTFAWGFNRDQKSEFLKELVRLDTKYSDEAARRRDEAFQRSKELHDRYIDEMNLEIKKQEAKQEKQKRVEEKEEKAVEKFEMITDFMQKGADDMLQAALKDVGLEGGLEELMQGFMKLSPGQRSKAETKYNQILKSRLKHPDLWFPPNTSKEQRRAIAEYWRANAPGTTPAFTMKLLRQEALNRGIVTADEFSNMKGNIVQTDANGRLIKDTDGNLMLTNKGKALEKALKERLNTDYTSLSTLIYDYLSSREKYFPSGVE